MENHPQTQWPKTVIIFLSHMSMGECEVGSPRLDFSGMMLFQVSFIFLDQQANLDTFFSWQWQRYKNMPQGANTLQNPDCVASTNNPLARVSATWPNPVAQDFFRGNRAGIGWKGDIRASLTELS